MKRVLRKLSGHGDDVVAEWDTETVSPERLKQIEQEFNTLLAQGYFAGDITDGKNTLVKEFSPDADYVMIPRVQGG